MKKIVAMASLFLASSQVFAGTWFYDVRVQYLYAGTVGGRYAVKLVGINPNPDSCSNSYDLAIEDTNPKLKEMWSALLSSYMGDKPVGIFLQGCIQDRPKITDIIIGSIP